MKKRLLSKVLAVLVAFSMLSTTALAAYVAEVDSGTGDVTQYETFQDAVGNTSAYDTLRLLDNVTVDLANEDWPYGVMLPESATFDLNSKELKIVADNVQTDLTIVGIGITGYGENDAPTTIKNGTISMSVSSENKNPNVVGIEVASIGDVNITEVEIKSVGNIDIGTGILSTDVLGYGDFNANIVITDCTISGTDNAIGVDEESGRATIVSGAFENLKTTDNVVLDEENGTKQVDMVGVSKDSTIIVSKDTAAVSVDKDGKATLYNDLAEAVKANKDNLENIQLLKKDLTDDDKAALEKLEVKFENGVLSKVEKPVGPVTPIEPVAPILPVFPEVMDIASAPVSSGTTAIEDEAVPLAGLTPLSELISYLYTHEGSPDGEDAEGEYTLAMAWAIAKEIVSEDADPEEIVTGSILRDVMTAFAELLDTTFDVEIKTDDDAPVMNCGEILADFFEALEVKTK